MFKHRGQRQPCVKLSCGDEGVRKRRRVWVGTAEQRERQIFRGRALVGIRPWAAGWTGLGSVERHISSGLCALDMGFSAPRLSAWSDGPHTSRVHTVQTWATSPRSSKLGFPWRCFPTTPPCISSPTEPGSDRHGPSSCWLDPSTRSRWSSDQERWRPRR